MPRMNAPLRLALAATLVAAAGSNALAQTSSPPPAPYSLPFALRSAVAGTSVRSDTSYAMHDGGDTLVELLSASYKLAPDFALGLRQGWVNESPDAGPSASALSNLALGATFAPKLAGDFRLVPFLGVALPTAQGGGNTPDATKGAAVGAGVWARSAMDNAMFAKNDLVVYPGLGLAYVANGLTVQAEATVLELMRVRGADKQADASKTNLTAGLHVGYFVVPMVSLAAELRHQRWLSSPVAVTANDTMRDTTTAAAGARVHLKLGDGVWLRPGVSYARPIDDPMAKNGYQIVGLDVPLSF